MPYPGLLHAVAVQSLLLGGPVNRTWDFIHSIGVNTHISWQNSGSAYANVSAVENSLAYLGATHVRDGIPYAGWTLPEYIAIAQIGVRFDILASGPTIDIQGDIAATCQLEAAVPSSVATMEGANEFNAGNYTYQNDNSNGNPQWLQLYGPPLYQAVQDSNTLSGVAVIAASMSNAGQTQIQQEGDVSSFVDSANWHTYFGNGEQPAANIDASVAAALATAPGKPVTITETGYYTAIQAEQWGGGGVNRPVQAILTLNTLLDAFADGASTTYIYELLDNIAHPSNTDLEDSFGLFLADGTPKPAAIAIHNLVGILADSGSTASNFSVSTFHPTIAGLPSSANALALQKSNGSLYLVLWNEPQIWNQSTHTQVVPAATRVTVQIGASPQAVNAYFPTRSNSPLKSWLEARTVTVELGAVPIILEVLPRA